MSATPTPEVREFILIGQERGASYHLWDIAPAPVDETELDIALEEIGVDVSDAFGEVNTSWGTTAREALDAFLAGMRKQTGLDDYGLTADSNTGGLDEPEPARALDAVWASPPCSPVWSTAGTDS
ncbi:hypothetical protein [Streptomyces sp. Root369]|uniref:hypothetical protein n=1 Tax=Streptomyces sp. Root369 TaxID=1736523 RepID=UPI00070BF9C0|nr:hypothetical protein [Streptomyces sp. Root369]KQW13538.1 hypothetical protein ASD08_30690 [Streptomyces sp. Root369]